MKFRKKPVVIEAIEFNGTTGWGEAPDWLVKATQKNPTDIGSLVVMRPGIAVINTLEGKMIASSGDMIIRGLKGELYPCKPDIFAATYEPV